MNYTHGMFESDIERICRTIDDSRTYDSDGKLYDAVVAIARGGLVPGVVLSHKLKAPLRVIDWSYRDHKERSYTNIGKIGLDLQLRKRVLIVDDILDSGKTLMELYRALGIAYGTSPGFKVDLAVLIHNVTADVPITPSFKGREIDRNEFKNWVNFWWE